MATRDIIVVGASAGGLSPLSSLMEQLPEDFEAAVFIVRHMATDTPELLADILDRAGALPVQQAEDGGSIERGRGYVARPDYHLTLERERMRLVRGPRENRARPAVDPLFRSAARTYGAGVVGVVLSGNLDDGTSGLWAIKEADGVAIVQDPDDALYPSMPRSALEHVEVDYQVPAAEMGAVLQRLMREPIHDDRFRPTVESATVAAHEEAPPMYNDPEEAATHPENQGHATALSCPECNGPLWEVQEGPTRRYRCTIGHSYTGQTLLEDQSEAVERALSVAMRTLEERARMLERMAREARERERSRSAEAFDTRAEEAKEHAASIRQVLQRGTQA